MADPLLLPVIDGLAGGTSTRVVSGLRPAPDPHLDSCGDAAPSGDSKKRSPDSSNVGDNGEGAAMCSLSELIRDIAADRLGFFACRGLQDPEDKASHCHSGRCQIDCTVVMRKHMQVVTLANKFFKPPSVFQPMAFYTKTSVPSSVSCFAVCSTF